MITRTELLNAHDPKVLQILIDCIENGCDWDYYSPDFIKSGCGNFIYKKRHALRFRYCPHCGCEIKL